MKNLSTETSYWVVTSPLHHLPCAVFRQRFSHQLAEERLEDKKPTTSGRLLSMRLQLGNITHCNSRFSFLPTLSLLLSVTPVQSVLLKIIPLSSHRAVMARGEEKYWVGRKALFHDGYQDLLLLVPICIVPDADPHSYSLLTVPFSYKMWWFLLKYYAVTHKSPAFEQHG